ncbi:MAG: ATP-dependent DNA helicase RecG [Deltaproteobacteria bacterium]|nr:ATP-dependent DNA helicase RecG [Deltaproteobacteria bacterium]
MNEHPRHLLATPVQYVKGVGPVLAGILAKMGILTVGDLFHIVPQRYLDRRQVLPIATLAPGPDRTVIGNVVASGISFLGRRRKRIYEIILEDESSARVSAKWFHFHEKYLKEKFALGTKVVLSGEVTAFGNAYHYIHPETDVLTAEKGLADIAGKILPVYPLTEGLYQKTLRKIVRNAWDTYHQSIEPVFPEAMIEEHQLADPWQCLQELHFPSPDVGIELLSGGRTIAHRTLIFEEFFFLELGMALRRQSVVEAVGIASPRNDQIHELLLKALPFTLTPAQGRVIAEIRADLERPRPMNRLLQGDVGSGKTVVALAGALQVIANGHQVAIMAPTEILAEQHFSTLTAFLAPLGIPHGLLTSSVKGVEREEIMRRLSTGELPLIVGTHALIQEGVTFAKLGLIVVDEQHRFGVLQRAALKEKGKHCDLLIMTATPIPRTLALTLYGDLDVSVLDELPPGRKPIITKLYAEHLREKLYTGIRHELERGRQIYVVYPLIEESEKVDLKNATDMAEELKKVFEPDYRLELLHGRMKGDSKERVMADFKAGKIHVLVATSVVEVGVDVPNASVMVIEHAERFGLSQLHQLRGRVGRSEHQSYCILMADYRQSDDAKRRLEIMVQTTDGFKIAEEDLAIRGPGEFIGTRQSGIPPFRIGNLARDVAILSKAREAAFRLIERDPRLKAPEHAKIRQELITRWSGRLNLAQVS